MTPIAARFREARCHAGLSVAAVAVECGISDVCVWDLESYDDELMTAYTAADLQCFARVLATTPSALLGVEPCDDPISVDDLAAAITTHCERHGTTLDDFSQAVGWDLTAGMNMSESLRASISLDGLAAIGGELGIEWRRLVNGLSTQLSL
ncbi:MAG: hypothetical protein QM754_08335 [Tepidisphaeraceae bacterium]